MKTKKIQSPLRVGNKVLIRTVTMMHTGLIVALTKEEILLDRAAWIADSGRFFDALSKGALNEVEPFVGVVSVARGGVIDVCTWGHELPEAQR
mgnify:CR=1 FL=1